MNNLNAVKEKLLHNEWLFSSLGVEAKKKLLSVNKILNLENQLIETSITFLTTSYYEKNRKLPLPQNGQNKFIFPVTSLDPISNCFSEYIEKISPGAKLTDDPSIVEQHYKKLENLIIFFEKNKIYN